MNIRTELNEENNLVIYLKNRIDSKNSSHIEKEIIEAVNENDYKALIMDLKDLEYISSAGLRIFLKIKKRTNGNVEIINADDEVFNIFSMTGFTKLLSIKKAMRHISIEGLKPIAVSINGNTYNLPGDEVVKVYKKDVKLKDIEKERKIAQKALILGVPTVIPYDIVTCGNNGNYGLIYEELPGAVSLASKISKHPDRLDEYAVIFGDVVRELHSIDVEDEDLPSIKDRYMGWRNTLSRKLSPEDSERIKNMISAMPDRNTYVNGDIRIDNVMVFQGELIFTDMAASGFGHPIFDLQGLYASLVELEKVRPYYSSTNYGLSTKQCERIWKTFYRTYMGDINSENFIKTNNLLKQYYVLSETLAKAV